MDCDESREMTLPALEQRPVHAHDDVVRLEYRSVPRYIPVGDSSSQLTRTQRSRGLRDTTDLVGHLLPAEALTAQHQTGLVLSILVEVD